MDDEKQKDEIIALESIYNKEEFLYHKENCCYQCTFKIFINLPKGYHITFKDTRRLEENQQKIEISHLPPLSLYVVLPKDYPSNSPPKFTICSSWLRQSLLAKVCRKLDALWEENRKQEILFVWVAFLRYETLEFLNIQESLKMDYAYTRYKKTLEAAQNAQKHNLMDNTDKECTNDSIKDKREKKSKVKSQYSSKKNLVQKYYDERAYSDCPIERNPIQVLIDYNEKRNHVEFMKNFYTCKICFADKAGERCTRFLPCLHVFCKDCIAEYVEVKIKEGNVQNIHCPEEKCTSEVTPAQVKDLVSSEAFAKYDSILLNVTLDTMSDIIYCPRRNCQYPVSCEPNEQVANCPICQYAFCIYCKMVYHGIEPCKVSSVEKQQLVAEYEAASNDKKIQMEQRYGKKQLQLLMENIMSENWIKSNSQKCPQCDTSYEKSDGCNKMICRICNAFFCWLCGDELSRDKPYEHYRNPKSKCFSMLYYGMIPEEDEFFEFPFYPEYESEDEEFHDDREEYDIDYM